MSKLVKMYIAEMVRSAKVINKQLKRERSEESRAEMQRELDSIIADIALYLM
ncbi:MAG: hypothetical protein IKJ78_04050 [Bacteroidales bacterium]|nr:hypothetical protein [Bacteroidales bacterium]